MSPQGWGRGSVADAHYRIHFQAAQTPAHLALVCALAGLAWRGGERLCIADLGCGRGYTANVLAAANPGRRLLGLDSSPAAIAEARSLAAAAGLDNTRFEAADLGALDEAALDALPPLDVVTLHGVWTWVDDGVRAGIVRLLVRRLKPGGLLYVGYNALPAAAADFALQRLLLALAGARDPAPGGAEAAALRAVAALRALAPRLPLPQTAMLQRLLADPPQLEAAFVAHEFLTDHWRPVYHEELCEALAPARLEFAGSTNLFEALPGLFVSPQQQAVLQQLPVGPAHEFAKDLVLPRSFRADVFVRGRVPARRGPGDLVVAACAALPEAPPTLSTGAAQVELAPAAWAELRQRLAQGPQTLDRLRHGLPPAPPSAAELLALLDANRLVLPWQPGPQAPPPSARRFNLVQARALADDAAAAGHFALAAPGAGGALPADALDLALAAALLGGADPHDAAALAAPLRDAAGAPLEAAAVAARLAERLPVWQRFGVL